MIVLVKKENLKENFEWLLKNNYKYYINVNVNVNKTLEIKKEYGELSTLEKMSESFLKMNRDIFIHIGNNKKIKAYDIFYEYCYITFDEMIIDIRKEKFRNILKNK